MPSYNQMRVSEYSLSQKQKMWVVQIFVKVAISLVVGRWKEENGTPKITASEKREAWVEPGKEQSPKQSMVVSHTKDQVQAFVQKPEVW